MILVRRHFIDFYWCVTGHKHISSLLPTTQVHKIPEKIFNHPELKMLIYSFAKFVNNFKQNWTIIRGFSLLPIPFSGLQSNTRTNDIALLSYILKLSDMMNHVIICSSTLRARSFGAILAILIQVSEKDDTQIKVLKRFFFNGGSMAELFRALDFRVSAWFNSWVILVNG